MATIRDVADLAGVSIATVSRVINGSPKVSPTALSSVRSAMTSLRYAPSDRRPGPKPASRNKRRAANLAFLVFGTSARGVTPAFQDLLYGVSAATAALEANLVFSHIPDPTKLPPMFDQQVDGLLLHGVLPTGAVRDRLVHFPTVWLMGNRRRPDWGDQVMPDSYTVGELAAQHLLARGHKHLVFLNLEEDHWPFRVYGHSFQATGEAAGAEVRQLHHAQSEGKAYWRPYSAEHVDELISLYAALTPRPTGVFVADDRQVALIQPALQARGIQVGPGGVEIVSCNNERPYLTTLSPQPQEIDIRPSAIGERGVSQLLWRLEHADVREQIVSTVEPKLVKAGT